jgi:hypothetical protein
MRIALLTGLILLVAAAPAAADTLAVDDSGDADLSTCSAAPGDCTLRGALGKATADPDADTITLPATRIRIAAPLPQIKAGRLTIQGVSARSSIIDASGHAAPVLVSRLNLGPVNTTLRDLQVTGAARTPSSIDAAVADVQRLERVAIVDNQSIGLALDSGATVVDSLIARNTGDGFGGVLSSGGTVIRNSTIADNTAGSLTENQEIALGAGLFNLVGVTTVEHSTITGNRIAAPASLAAGTDVGSLAATSPSLVIRSSVIGGKGGPDCGGPVTSQGHNVDADGSCGFAGLGDQSRVDPRLGTLGDNGGPTDTIPLLDGSPAIDAGDDCPGTDQRGVASAQGATCDAGAFESPFTRPVAPPPSVPPVTPATPPAGPPGLPPADTTPPKVTLDGVGRKVSRKALRKGVKVKVGANAPIAAEIALIVTPHRVTVASATDLVLATGSLARAPGSRTVTLKPAHQPAGRRAVPAQVRVVAFDAAGNRAVKTARFTIK